VRGHGNKHSGIDLASFDSDFFRSAFMHAALDFGTVKCIGNLPPLGLSAALAFLDHLINVESLLRRDLRHHFRDIHDRDELNRLLELACDKTSVGQDLLSRFRPV
jgi:hypothetical protein